MLYKIIFLTAITTFFLSSYFLGWMSGISQLVGGVNEYFFSQIPLEFQILITGFLIVVLIGLITWFIY